MSQAASGMPADVELALGYPFARAPASFVLAPGAGALTVVAAGDWTGAGVLVGGEVGAPPRSLAALGLWGAREPFPGAGAGRRALLAYGANGSPAALRSKLAAGDGSARAAVPVLRARLADFDAVYSAHVSPYGSIPATLLRSPGTALELHVVCLTPAQEALVAATELNYEPAAIDAPTLVPARAGDGAPPALHSVLAYRSRHGALALGGRPVALAAIAARGRSLTAIGEPELLAAVRDQLEPGADLTRFVARAIREPAIAARRTATLERTALPLGW